VQLIDRPHEAAARFRQLAGVFQAVADLKHRGVLPADQEGRRCVEPLVALDESVIDCLRAGWGDRVTDVAGLEAIGLLDPVADLIEARDQADTARSTALVDPAREAMSRTAAPDDAHRWAATKQAYDLAAALLDPPEAHVGQMTPGQLAAHICNPSEPLDLQHLQDDRSDDYAMLRWVVLAGVADMDMQAFHQGERQPRRRPRVLHDQLTADWWCDVAGELLGTEGGRALIGQWLDVIETNAQADTAGDATDPNAAGAVGSGMAWQEALPLIESHVKAHDGVFPSIKKMAEIIGCSREPVRKAIAESPYLKARHAETEARRRGAKAPRFAQLPDGSIDRAEQQTEPQPDDAAALAELTAEQEADDQRDERQAVARRRRSAFK